MFPLSPLNLKKIFCFNLSQFNAFQYVSLSWSGPSRLQKLEGINSNYAVLINYPRELKVILMSERVYKYQFSTVLGRAYPSATTNLKVVCDVNNSRPCSGRLWKIAIFRPCVTHAKENHYGISTGPMLSKDWP